MLWQPPLDFLLWEKGSPVCLNVYNQASCYLQPNTFLTGTVPSGGVGRKDFFWLSMPVLLLFPHPGLSGPRSIPSPEVVPDQFWLQQEVRFKCPTSGAFCTFHINSRVISPKHKPEHGAALPPDPTTFSRTLRMTFSSLPGPSRPFPPRIQLTFAALNPLPPHQAPSPS